jgi:hypothetical protein
VAIAPEIFPTCTAAVTDASFVAVLSGLYGMRVALFKKTRFAPAALGHATAANNPVLALVSDTVPLDCSAIKVITSSPLGKYRKESEPTFHAKLYP